MQRAHDYHPRSGGYIPTCLCDHPEADALGYDGGGRFAALWLVVFALLMIFSISVLGFHCDAITLSDKETQEIVDASRHKKEWAAAFDQAVIDAVNTPGPVKAEAAISVVGHIQATFGLKLADELEVKERLSAHRLAHGCAECVYSEDFKG